MQSPNISNFECGQKYRAYLRQLKKEQISEVCCIFAIAFLFGFWLFAVVLIHL